jgi:hypothetical protein
MSEQTDRYIARLKKSGGPIGITWLEFVTQYPNRAARMLEQMTAINIDIYETCKKIKGISS